MKPPDFAHPPAHDNGVRSKGRNPVSFATDLKGRDRPVHDITGVLLPALFEKGVVGSVQRAPVHLIVAKIFPKRAGLKVRDRFGKQGCATPAGPLRVKVPVVVGQPVVRVAGVKVCGEHQLLLVIGAINSVGLFFGFCQSGQKHTGEDCDDRNHDQKFD